MPELDLPNWEDALEPVLYAPADEALLAMTIWGEARGEPREGQAAVGHVALNRLRAGRWGKDLTSVLLAPKQFSAWNDPVATFGKGPDAKAFRAIQALARRLLRGEVPDPTGGATHYYNPMVVEPPWAQQLKPVGTIGRHVFYK